MSELTYLLQDFVSFWRTLSTLSQIDAWKKLKLPKVGKRCLKFSLFLWFTKSWNGLCETFVDIKEILKSYKMSPEFNFNVTSCFLGNVLVKLYLNIQCPPPTDFQIVLRPCRGPLCHYCATNRSNLRQVNYTDTKNRFAAATALVWFHYSHTRKEKSWFMMQKKSLPPQEEV